MKQVFTRQHKQRFSLRKYSFGLASVFIGSTLLFGCMSVSAEETSVPVNAEPVLSDSANASNEVGSDALEPPLNTEIIKNLSEKEAPEMTSEVTEEADACSLDSLKVSEGVTSFYAKPEEENPVLDDSVNSKLSPRGTYHFDGLVAVKNEPVTTAPTEFYFDKGYSVNYDKVLQNDGHDWISYISYNGMRRYADMGKSQDSQPAPKSESKPKVTEVNIQGNLTITNQTNSGFDVVVSDVTSLQGIVEVQVPVWSEQGGQDDLVWYRATKESDGNYRARVSVKDHKNSRGEYNIHLYYALANGKQVIVSGTKTTLPSPSVNSKLSPRGTYHFDGLVAVKNEPVTTAPTEFYFDKGYSVNYDKVLQNDGHDWISYISYNGMRRYADMGKSQDSQPAPKSESKPKVTEVNIQGNLTITNQTNSGFDVVVSDVTSPQGIVEVQVPVWSEQGGQDDLVWYRATKESDGNYRARVSVKDHKNSRGEYNIHLYYALANGKQVIVSGTKTTLPSPSVNSKLSPRGTYHFDGLVAVKNEPVTTAPTEFYFDKGYSVNYDKVLQNDGHDWISYISYNGMRRYADMGKSQDSQPAPKSESKPKVTEVNIQGNLTITNQTNSGFDVVVSDVTSPQGIVEVQVPVWSEQGGQDDLVWYRATKESDGNYRARVSVKDHKNSRGEYNIHLYYALANGKQVIVSGTKTTLPSPSVNSKLSPRGTYHFDGLVAVKNEPVTTAPTEFYFDKGYSVNYDKVLQNDGHDWISYISYNGMRRYADMGKSQDSQPAPKSESKPKVTEVNIQGNLTITNQTNSGFDVVVSDVTSPQGIVEVQVPVWSEQGGQDDIQWYTAQQQDNGDYKVSVAISRHHHNEGNYHIHLYYLQKDGSLTFVTGQTTKVKVGADKHMTEPSFNGSYYSVLGKYGEVIIVNKKYALSPNYNPGENPVAKDAFIRLRNDMMAQGYSVGYGYSGFRSYSYQTNLYNNYVYRDGKANADRYSARPGHSEHQTGLAYDLTDRQGNLLEEARASQWLKENAHHYGFVVRYLPNKEHITGFMSETWHIRYIGREAEDIYHSGLTLEEYFGIDGGGYQN